MGYITPTKNGLRQKKGSNAGKVPQPHLDELQEVFHADIQAEALMNGIPPDLIP